MLPTVIDLCFEMFESPESRVKTCSSSPASRGTTGSKICFRLISTSQTAAHINNPWERLESCQQDRRRSEYGKGSSQLHQKFLSNCFWMSDSSSINSSHVILLVSNYVLGYRSANILYCHCQRVTMGFTLSISHCQRVRIFLKPNSFCRRQRGLNAIQAMPFDSTQKPSITVLHTSTWSDIIYRTKLFVFNDVQSVKVV